MSRKIKEKIVSKTLNISGVPPVIVSPSAQYTGRRVPPVIVSPSAQYTGRRVPPVIGILGYGEVGRAIARFYQNPRIKDLKKDDGLEGIEILNVCIPWSKNFVKIVKKEIQAAKPKLTIIHSTVPLNTTKKIGGMVVHSPVRGVHPELYEGIRTFVKYIGTDSKKAGELAKKHLQGLGIKTKVYTPSATTEALKLWETTQYGWFIILNKEVKKWCDKKGLNFEAIYTEANQSYNKGYQKLGRREVVRPFLKYMAGPIGGHCVVPNCHLLDSEIARFILKKNKLQNYGK